MQSVTNQLTRLISDIFSQLGYDPAFGSVIASDRPDLCQFQCNGAFAAAKAARQNPVEIAAHIVNILRRDHRFSNVQTVGGFINLTLNDQTILYIATQLYDDPYAGVPQTTQPETIFLDYGGPNIAKPLHIGHLRAAVIGQALKNLVRATGRTAVSDIHLGDWGLPMGLVIAQLCEGHPAAFSDSAGHLTAQQLNTLYPLAAARGKTDPDFLQTARQITVFLQMGDPKYTAIWKRISELSVKDLKSTYADLCIDFDLWQGESDAAQYIPALLTLLREKHLLRHSDGALVTDVTTPFDNPPLPPVLLQNKNGGSTYAATDLAAVMQRQKDFAPNQIWYIVDKRQHLHFQQVFRCAEKAGVAAPGVLRHLEFGTMNGRNGKPFKTRDGGVMQLSELFNAVYHSAYDRLKNSPHSPKTSIADTAHDLAVAAIKFGDLCNHRSKDYIFDPEKFLAKEGKSGGFLLYTTARINSLLAKADKPPQFTLRGVYSQHERDLLLTLLMDSDACTTAWKEAAPNYICESAYRIACAFSAFYHNCPILQEQDSVKRASRLSLCLLTKKILENRLRILGISPVEQM